MAQTGQQRGARKKVTQHSHSRARRTRDKLSEPLGGTGLLPLMTREPTEKFGLVARFSHSFYRYTRTSLRMLEALLPLEIAVGHRQFPRVPVKTAVRTHSLLVDRWATHTTRETRSWSCPIARSDSAGWLPHDLSFSFVAVADTVSEPTSFARASPAAHGG